MTQPGRGRIVAGVLLLVCLLGIEPLSWSQEPTESDVHVDRGILAYDVGPAVAALLREHGATE